MKSFLKKTIKSLIAPKRPRRGRVGFDKHVVVHEVPISPRGEVVDRWYGIHDYKRFQAKNKVFLKQRQKMKSFKASARQLRESTCELEIQQPKNRTKSMSNRRISLTAVLQEQAMQWMESVNDPQSIAEAYSHFSRLSKDDALLNARRDEEFVRKMIDEEESVRKMILSPAA
jgi:hypothetical protein